MTQAHATTRQQHDDALAVGLAAVEKALAGKKLTGPEAAEAELFLAATRRLLARPIVTAGLAEVRHALLVERRAAEPPAAA